MNLSLPVRYLAMHNNGPDDIVESNIRYREEIWEIDPRQSAFVLVDFWSLHIMRSHLERSIEITEKVIAPLLPLARKAGIVIVHGPGLSIAKHYEGWDAYGPNESDEPPQEKPKDWPPEDFRQRTGRYSRFARPFFEPDLEREWRKRYDERRIIEAVEPEPQDFIISSGGELHRLLSERKILHLFYMGFSTDGCVQDKTYAIKPMRSRGYNILLLRDGTTGKETQYTLKDMLVTRMAISQIELYNVTVLSADLKKALLELLGEDA